MYEPDWEKPVIAVVANVVSGEQKQRRKEPKAPLMCRNCSPSPPHSAADTNIVNENTLKIDQRYHKR